MVVFRRTSVFLASSLTFWLIWQLQSVSTKAQALSVGTAVRPVSYNRVTRTIIWGLIKPFRTGNPPTQSHIDKATVQPYNLGIQSAKARTKEALLVQAKMSTAAVQVIPTGPTTDAYDDVIALRGGRQKQRLRRHSVNVPHASAAQRLGDPATTTTTVTTSTTTPTTESIIGSLIQPFRDSVETSSGDICLDRLLAACHKYKDAMYAFGQRAIAENLNQNIQKIEAAVRQTPSDQRTTLRSLLEYEKSVVGVKKEDGKLDESSAAMSLLWMRRSLSFQCRLNECLVDQPDLSPLEAAVKAYELELEPYHSWGLRKVFKMGLRTTAVPRGKTFAKMRGSPLDYLDETEETRTMQEMKHLSDTCKPLLSEWKRTFEMLDLEDDSKV